MTINLTTNGQAMSKSKQDDSQPICLTLGDLLAAHADASGHILGIGRAKLVIDQETAEAITSFFAWHNEIFKSAVLERQQEIEQ